MSIIIGGDFWAKPGKNLPVIKHDDLEFSIRKADAFVVNFEGALHSSAHSSEVPKIGPALVQDSSCLEWLKNIGVTAVTLANNHSLDLGDSSVSTALKSFSDQGIEVFGWENGCAESPNWSVYRCEVDRTPVSVVSFAEEEFNGRASGEIGACLADPIDIWRVIQTEKEANRAVIVLAHGGVEYEHLPPPHFIKLCRWVIDCGAVAVITHHPHVPGYTDSWNGSPIVWSVGDFWLPTSKISDWQYFGSAIELSLENGKVLLKEFPYRLDYQSGSLRSLTEDESAAYTRLREGNLLQSKPDAYSAWWHKLLEKKSEGYTFMYSMAAIPIKVRKYFSYLFRRGYTSDTWLLKQLNGLRCASHREVWIASLMLVFNKKRNGLERGKK